jgi:hypothetical protein
MQALAVFPERRYVRALHPIAIVLLFNVVITHRSSSLNSEQAADIG